MAEHLSQPINRYNDDYQPAFNTNQNIFKVQSHNDVHLQDAKQDLKNNLSNTPEEKWMFELIYAYVIPKWIKYLQLKSERSIDTQVKPRPDTLWKKILRDVREFFRILFRLRFHHLEFKDVEGAALWIQTLFDELGNTPCRQRSEWLQTIQICASNSQGKEQFYWRIVDISLWSNRKV